jgi:hypothetical protein
VKSIHPNLQMVATHLNASVGETLKPEHLITALQAGSIRTVPAAAGSLISYLFVETKPEQIMGCAFEAQASVQQIQSLYVESLHHNLPCVPNWERAVAAWL